MTQPKRKQLRHRGLLVMMDDSERSTIDEAARKKGLRTGTWMRMIALAAAKRALAPEEEG